MSVDYHIHACPVMLLEPSSIHHEWSVALLVVYFALICVFNLIIICVIYSRYIYVKLKEVLDRGTMIGYVAKVNSNHSLVVYCLVSWLQVEQLMPMRM